jgi:predicted nuclease with TOPRIM domain
MLSKCEHEIANLKQSLEDATRWHAEHVSEQNMILNNQMKESSMDSQAQIKKLSMEISNYKNQLFEKSELVKSLENQLNDFNSEFESFKENSVSIQNEMKKEFEVKIDAIQLDAQKKVSSSLLFFTLIICV